MTTAGGHGNDSSNLGENHPFCYTFDVTSPLFTPPMCHIPLASPSPTPAPSRRGSVQTWRAAPPNMVGIWVEAHVLPAAKGLATARAEKLDLDRPGVRLRVADIPLRDRRLGQAHKQRLEGVCLRGALGRVAVPPAAVGREDRGFVKVWTKSDQSGCDAGYENGKRCETGNEEETHAFVP